MESPNKRLKMSEASDDFVSFGGDGAEDKAEQYGYISTNGQREHDNNAVLGAPTDRGAMQQQDQRRPWSNRNAWNDPRNAKDRPKSKHALPGHEPWILVKTKYGRRFVHNTETKESFWYIPQDVMPGVHEYERWELQQKEKEGNAKWAEEQLQEMRGKSQVDQGSRTANGDGRNRRRRSESLQREDEEVMMAELAAEAEHAEEKDAKEAVENVASHKPITQQAADDAGYDSDSSYEEVEVTDSEFEDDEDRAKPSGSAEQETGHDEWPVEFGEDDIAYQLAAMGGEDDLDPEDYDEEENNEGVDEDEGQLTDEDAANLFRDMLDDHHISPFTPWEKIIEDETDTGIIMDDRYTVLSSMRARKEVWEVWVKDTAARLKEQRAQMGKLNPRIPYLAFLAEKATPKLYWPEFKRKFKKDAEMNDRKLSEKDRERLYRDHINRLKLPEKTRKADLVTLLNSTPLGSLSRHTSLDILPQAILSHLHFISLPINVRDEVVSRHIASLPSAPKDEEEGELGAEQRAHEDKKREDRRKREQALADRQHKVDEERRKAEKEERWAKQDLRQGEDELRQAMAVGSSGIKTHLMTEG